MVNEEKLVRCPSGSNVTACQLINASASQDKETSALLCDNSWKQDVLHCNSNRWKVKLRVSRILKVKCVVETRL